jgi:acyl carrier protein
VDLRVFPDINLIPDWPRIRKLVAKRLGRSEDESQDMAEQAMAKSDSLLDPAELVMAIEEGLGIQIDGYPQS